ncbi:MAG: inorganic diphosphatase [Candidatus Bathyarchaeia archaeon]
MSLRLEAGPNPPEEVYVLVEIPKGSQNKYEYDEKLGIITLDRVLHSPLHYPADYGHIPSTLCKDGDPLDALVLVTEPTFPGCVIIVRPVGAIEMEDEEGPDDKILAVPKNDPRFAHVTELKDLPGHLLKEIVHFFEEYKALEPNKWTRVNKWIDTPEAKEIVMQAVEMFQEGSM